MNIFRWLSGLIGSFCLAASIGLPTTSAGKVFDVRQFGAKGDGKTIDTPAIQQALDEAGKAGGTVRFTRGTYLSKPIVFQAKRRSSWMMGPR